MRQALLFWASCWSVFAFLFLPFTVYFLPKVGVGLSTFILPINKQICAWVGVEIQRTYLISDSLAFYSTAFILVLFSGLITAVVFWRFKHVISKIQHVLLTILIVLLAFFLIRYGLDKLFNRQFYTPASNTLHTPTGQLSKDILFWTSMGTSSFYNCFMGIIEILPGILLFFSRTRFLGLLMAFSVFGNILAINIGFDITVKYLSGLLLFTSVVCLLFYSERVKSLFTGKSAEKNPPILSDVWILILFTPFLVDLGMTYWGNTKTESGQSYAVLSTDSSSELFDKAKIARVHLHPAGYFITEDTQQQFTSYKMAENRKFVIVNKQLIPFSLHGDTLDWREGKKVIRWKLKAIDLKKLPLKQDETNWYFETTEGL